MAHGGEDAGDASWRGNRPKGCQKGRGAEGHFDVPSNFGSKSWVPTGMGTRGHLPPSGNVKCFVHCKTPSRRIIYALFSQPVIGFSGLRPNTPTRAPSLDPTRGLSSLDPLFAHPFKKSCRRPCILPPESRWFLGHTF